MSARQVAYEKMQRLVRERDKAMSDVLDAAEKWDAADERATEQRALRDAVMKWRRAKALYEKADREFESK